MTRELLALVERNDVKGVREFLSRYPGLEDLSTSFRVACLSGNPAIASLIGDHGRVEVSSHLFSEVFKMNDARLNELLVKADRDFVHRRAVISGSTPLHHQCELANFEAVKFLVDHCGADVNARDHEDATPLHKGVRCVKITKYLIEKGADANAVSKMDCTDEEATETLLHHVCNLANEVETLVYAIGKCRAGAVNAVDAIGKTPLHVAVEFQGAEFVKRLIEHGADPFIEDAEGCTPRQYLTNIIGDEESTAEERDMLVVLENAERAKFV